MIFQYSSQLVKDQSTFYEIIGLGICIKIKAFMRVETENG